MSDAGSQPYILIYGSDAGLLKTRQWVLETAGFKVLYASSGREAERLLSAAPVAILLLCHSLTMQACKEVIAAAAAINPRTCTLIFDGKTAPDVKDLCDGVLDATKGPGTLIEVVQSLIASMPEQRAPLQIVARRQ